MPQVTRRWISEKVKLLPQSNLLPFSDILDAEMVNSALASAGVTLAERATHLPARRHGILWVAPFLLRNSLGGPFSPGWPLFSFSLFSRWLQNRSRV
jgi:hypothetical protein